MSTTIQDRSVVHSFEPLAFNWSIFDGDLDALKALREQAPLQWQKQLESDDYAALVTAAKKGHAQVVEWLLPLVPHNWATMNRPFVQAATYGQLGVLKLLGKHLEPNLLLKLVKSEDSLAFRSAAKHAHIPVLKWMKDCFPADWMYMLQGGGRYDVFFACCEQGALDGLHWLKSTLSESTFKEMLQSQGSEALHGAIMPLHFKTIKFSI
jgi:hypothetical protein